MICIIIGGIHQELVSHAVASLHYDSFEALQSLLKTLSSVFDIREDTPCLWHRFKSNLADIPTTCIFTLGKR